ncbi:CHAP domain-containing protein [Staphylococcus sp. IVB6181]|uniref:CHAP domain-containing protein n=1 Tax=Staphylococcus sp. IVB6181 TaxID=2929481 RepID=UPI0021D11382|nr:CHAP domain-containing protein [Staphylococcus sp. IVB6181]UXV34198.1 CHAP domain-containing protein [Staphylococcus sp. IVB6181]
MKKLISAGALLVVLGGAAYVAVDHQDDIEHYIKQMKPDPMAFNPYDKGQCTDYVFEKVKKDGNMIGKSWGDAKYWHTKAKEDDYQVNQQPKVKSLMQSPRGEQGHVAYIEAIHDNGALYVTEMNYEAPHKVTSRTIQPERVQDYHYIHPKKNPKVQDTKDV